MVVLAGEMRRTFLIQKPGKARGTFGESATTKNSGWVDVVVRRGALLPISGIEAFAADGQYGEATVNIRLRYCSYTKQIKPNYRLLDMQSGEIFEVIYPVDSQDNHREILVLCKVITDVA